MARRLGNPKARSAAFVGTGVQARSHLRAFADLFPLQDIRVVGRGQANIDKLCEIAQGMGLRAKVCGTAQEALEGADLVVSSITLAYDTPPFLDARWLKPGAFAAVTDLGIPWLPEGLATLDAAYIDDREQEAASPKPLIDAAQVVGDLGEVVRGEVAAGFDATRRTAFLFRGLAIGDFAVAGLGYDRAVAAGAGAEIRA
jgi:ornithine cyclodeaminase/alanine dehydrogenase